jgi:EF-P beta-lysylation protein EpmB
MTDALPVHSIDSWQTQLQQVISSTDELLGLLELRPEQVNHCHTAANDFPIKVPMAFARRMRVGDPRDPLLLQVLARREETLDFPGYEKDPLAETGEAVPRRGLIHKYQGRVLLVLTGTCAVHCRYCFRRHFPYQENRNNRQEWQEVLDYVSNDPTIEEVILSGGDPLVASDSLLTELVSRLAAIDHVRRLRIHSRLPIVLPDRVTTGLLEAICHTSLKIIMVVHANHAREIDDTVGTAVTRMREHGITVLNQSVLLNGINDNAEALIALSECLFSAGILPYYLHLMDKVQGAAHFDLPEPRARQLMGKVAARLPGYLVPRLVREEAGGTAKTSLGFIY